MFYHCGLLDNFKPLEKWNLKGNYFKSMFN
jgi:hypothetical protein